MNIPDKISNYLQAYFDKILVVSVPRFTERHARVAANLKGLPFEFFWGADKLKLDSDTVKLDGTYDEEQAKKNQRHGKALNLGEIACSLSHRMLYEEMARQNWQKVLVLEDDVIPLLQHLNELPDALQELPPDWELAYLGYLKHEKVTGALKRKQWLYKEIYSRIGMIKWDRKMISNFLPRPFSNHLKKAGFHDCTHAYAITLEGAKKLLAAQTPVVYRADDLLSTAIMKGDINGFVTDPKFFDQEIFHNPAIVSEVRTD